MAVLGDSGKPSYSYFAFDGTTNPNQVAERLTAPSRIKIITLGAWIGGWNQVSQVVLGCWALDGTLLGRTASFNIANEGAAGDGQASLYTANLISPVIIEPGVVFYVGTNRDRASNGVIWLLGTTVNSHYRATGAHPDGALGSVSGPTSTSRRVGAYVADYQPVGVAYVRRGSSWATADGVYVYRSGAWVLADAVQVLRSGAWVDAE